jgi:hypothetical protein
VRILDGEEAELACACTCTCVHTASESPRLVARLVARSWASAAQRTVGHDVGIGRAGAEALTKGV